MDKAVWVPPKRTTGDVYLNGEVVGVCKLSWEKYWKRGNMHLQEAEINAVHFMISKDAWQVIKANEYFNPSHPERFIYEIRVGDTTYKKCVITGWSYTLGWDDIILIHNVTLNYRTKVVKEESTI